MKRKELSALFSEVSSKCDPVRGIYTAPPTERERIIRSELKKFRENALEKKEKAALEKLFLSQEGTFHSSEEFKAWFLALKERYSPENIPDSIYAKLMSVSGISDPQAVSSMIRHYLKQAP